MNIRVINITSTSFVVQWNEVDDTNQYYINWSSAGDSSRGVTTSQTSHTMTGLIPNTTYYVTIISVNSCRFVTDLSVTTLMVGSLVPTLTMITTTTLTIPNSFMMSSIIMRPTGSNITLYAYCISLTNIKGIIDGLTCSVCSVCIKNVILCFDR